MQHFAAAVPLPAGAQQAPQVAIDNDDIGGVVRAPNGQPEAGVWVIAETTELPTRYIKIVVTDDQGRYVLPDLPLNVNYQVWVRGYGLVDSPKMRAKPGQQLNHTSVPAPNEAAAAHYYPAAYWYAMMKIPGPDQFGGKGEVPEKITLPHYLNLMKNNGCIGCHQLGQESTRTIPAGLGEFKSHEDAWIRRVQSGQSGEQMTNQLAGLLGGAPFKYFGDWTARVAKGEPPKHKPTRPQGLERNIVVTQWEWGEPDKYLHDLIASDRRKPTVNAYGKLFGSPEYATDNDADPRSQDPHGDVLQDAGARIRRCRNRSDRATPRPSTRCSRRRIGDRRSSGTPGPTTTMRCSTRTAGSGSPRRVRGRDESGLLQEGLGSSVGQAVPARPVEPPVSILDPKTMKYTFIDTCFQTHHLQFAYDANDTLWTSGGGAAIGWINTKLFNETGDAVKSQGWTAHILDTNGDGKRGEYTEPNQPMDPTKDRRVALGYYAVMPNPADGSVWGTIAALGPAMVTHPGGVIRLDAGDKTRIPRCPKSTSCRSRASASAAATSTARASSGSRSRAATSAPSTAASARCCAGRPRPAITAPKAGRSTSIRARASTASARTAWSSSYYSWVDQHDVFGLGKDVPMSTANLMDGLVALKDGKMVSLKIPYPLGFYAKGFDGRIDDPNAGWKGRGLWTASGDRTPWLSEGGKGTLPRAVQIQIRPDPLAK